MIKSCQNIIDNSCLLCTFAGKITLITPFNYTLQKSHQFTVRATIGSEYSDAVVVVNVIDINNNCPVFGQSEVYSRLTTPVESGTIIAVNKATDADTGPALTYSIVAGDSAGRVINLACVCNSNRSRQLIESL